MRVPADGHCSPTSRPTHWPLPPLLPHTQHKPLANTRTPAPPLSLQVDEAEGARIAPHLAALGSAQPMASGDVGEAEPPAPTSDHIMVVVQVNPGV